LRAFLQVAAVEIWDFSMELASFPPICGTVWYHFYPKIKFFPRFFIKAGGDVAGWPAAVQPACPSIQGEVFGGFILHLLKLTH